MIIKFNEIEMFFQDIRTFQVAKELFTSNIRGIILIEEIGFKVVRTFYTLFLK